MRNFLKSMSPYMDWYSNWSKLFFQKTFFHFFLDQSIAKEPPQYSANIPWNINILRNTGTNII